MTPNYVSRPVRHLLALCRWNVSAFVCGLAFALSSLTTNGAVGDENWDSRFYVLLEHEQGVPSTIAFNNRGEMFIGGRFLRIGGLAGRFATNIARWNGTNWSPLGGGVNGEVRSILTVDDHVYVGGSFTTAGGLAITNIARWDGSNWWPVGGGLLGTRVECLVWSGSDLYVGGGFTNAGGVPVANIAKWDGQKWSPLAGGVTGFRPSVNAMMLLGSDLVAAGDFDFAAETSATNIARWNGNTWNAFGEGLPGTATTLTTNSAGELYAGGGTNRGGGSIIVGPPFIRRWNGTGWSELPAGSIGNNSAVTALFFYKDQLYVSSLLLESFISLARWDGAQWLKVDAPFYPRVQAATLHDGSVFVAGPRDDVMAPSPRSGLGRQYGIAKYDGSTWTIQGAGAGGYPRALAVVGENIVAGGQFQKEDPFVGEDLVAIWDGRMWQRMAGSPRSNNSSVMAIASSSEALYIGGTFPSNARRVAVRTGTNWVALSVPGVVHALAIDNTNLYAGGDFGVLHWKGTNWSSLGSGITGIVYAIAIDASGSVIAGGAFTNAGGIPANNIAKWNGSQWSALGSGVNDFVTAIKARGSDLVVGGAFTTAGEITANCIALWRSDQWTTLGTGFSEGLPRDNFLRPVRTSVNALELTSNGNIYAAGNFTKANGTPANFIALWDGARWQPLGSGLNRIAYTLALKDNDLYVGGEFTSVGSKPSSRIALWHGQSSLASGPRLAIQKTQTQVTLSWPASAGSFILESSSDVFGSSWSSVSYVFSDGQNVATNSLAAAQRFYRLRQN